VRVGSDNNRADTRGAFAVDKKGKEPMLAEQATEAKGGVDSIG
jgi:hypothetical protein